MVESERLRAQLQQQYFTCTVLKIPSGTFPKLITVRLPTIDSPANEARWFGTPPIEEGDSVICRRDPNDQDVLIIERSGDSPDPIFDILINNSGGALAANDVIVNDSSQDNSVTTTTTQSDTNSPGVIIGGADDGDEVMVKRVGVVTVILDATGSRGDFIQTSTTVKKINPTSTINAGVFGQLLEAGILDGTVQAVLFGLQGDLPASDVRIALGVGSPTIGQMQEYLDNTGSSGYFIGGEITDGGAGSINVAAGEGFIRETNNNNAPLLSFKWASSASIAVATDTTQYVFVDDTGTISLDPDEFLEAQDKILIGLATNEGGIIESIFNLGVRLAESIGQAGRYIRRVHSITRDVRKGGLIFGETGTRNVTVTTGVLWWGRTEYTITALDTSVSGGFDTYSASGKEATAATQWPNAQYDNAGVLTTMTNNRWAVLFFYLEPDDHVVMIYGRNQYTSQASAGMEAVPASSIPPRLVSSGILAAKFIFQKNAANAANILSSFDQVFASAGVTDHGNLAGLGDNDHPQYLLTSAQLWSFTPNAVDIYRNSNVGIGDFSASNPNRKLHVNGDVEITIAGGGSASGSEAMEIVSTGNNGTVGEGGYINFTDGTNTLAQIRSRAEAAGKYGLSFGTWDTGFAERVRIDASGNVGIGTTSPGYKLDVNGTSRFAADSLWDTNKAVVFRTSARNYIYSNATDELSFVAGAIEHIHFKGGNVGIGTVSPEHPLIIAGINDDTPILSLYNTGGVGIAEFQFSRNSVTGALSIQGTQIGANNIVLAPTSGNVGIGTTSPSYKLDVAGACHATSFPTSSDIRLKTDIQPLGSVLAKLKKITPVRFRWSYWHRHIMKRSEAENEVQIGMVAQEVEEEFPELITTWDGEGAGTENPYKALDYSRMTAVLVTAVNEQSTIIKNLISRIETLEQGK